jgi:hypothetical protein
MAGVIGQRAPAGKVTDVVSGSGAKKEDVMGLMDKVKAQATQLADKAQQAGQAGQAKLADIQSKRKGDALLLELGGEFYAQKVGRSDGGAETRIAGLVARLQAFEAEHGAVTVTSADAPDAGPPPTGGVPSSSMSGSSVPSASTPPAPPAPPPASSSGPLPQAQYGSGQS